jgi:hypothetical protein
VTSIEANLPVFGPAQVLQEDKPGGNCSSIGQPHVCDGAIFLQQPQNPRQRFVGQVAG